MGNAKATMLRVRVTPDERAALEVAAKSRNQTISEWIRSKLNAVFKIRTLPAIANILRTWRRFQGGELYLDMR